MCGKCSRPVAKPLPYSDGRYSNYTNPDILEATLV